MGPGDWTVTRMRWLLALVFLALGLYAWWQRPIDPPAAGPRLTQGEGAVAVEAEAVAATASASEPSPAAAEPGPNIATARWAAELQYPNAKPVQLPFPVDGGLDRAGARALYRKAGEIRDCYSVQIALDSTHWERGTGTRWLEPPERQRVLAGLQGAIQRQRASCRKHGMREDDPDAPPPPGIPPRFQLWARTSAAASGDPAARAEHYAYIRRQADLDSEIRPVVRALLLGDAQDLPALERLYGKYGRELPPLFQIDPRRAGSYTPPPNFEAIWLLVACDRGMDCGGTSLSADRLCLIRGLCGYPDVESAVRDGLLGESELETALQARANIVAALRRGDVDAIAGRGP